MMPYQTAGFVTVVSVKVLYESLNDLTSPSLCAVTALDTIEWSSEDVTHTNIMQLVQRKRGWNIETMTNSKFFHFQTWCTCGDWSKP